MYYLLTSLITILVELKVISYKGFVVEYQF